MLQRLDRSSLDGKCGFELRLGDISSHDLQESNHRPRDINLNFSKESAMTVPKSRRSIIMFMAFSKYKSLDEI